VADKTDIGWTEATWNVITGGESGKGDRRPRPVHVDAFRSIRDQCKEAGTAFFHKQNGSWLHSSQGRHAGLSGDQIHEWPDGTVSQLVGAKAAGAMLDGVTHEGRP
jgi:protein gp37